MKSKIQNLNMRLVSIRTETNMIRTELFELATKLVKASGAIVVPVNAVYEKKDGMSESEKQYNSVILDSFPVEFRNKDGVVRNAYMLSVQLDDEKQLVVHGYDGDFSGKKDERNVVQFPADELVNVEPLAEFLIQFARDPEEPEK